jgi:GNAT superfamily N-acetyltransferase
VSATRRAQLDREIAAYDDDISAGLKTTLAPPGSLPAIGAESGRPIPNGIARFRSKHGSTRYLYFVDRMAVSGLQVVSRDGRIAHVANVYTLPRYRKTGLARKLLDRARRDFAAVLHADEDDLSDDGRAWRDATESKR